MSGEKNTIQKYFNHYSESYQKGTRWYYIYSLYFALFQFIFCAVPEN